MSYTKDNTVVYENPPPGIKPGDNCQIVPSYSVVFDPRTRIRNSKGPFTEVTFISHELIDGPDDGDGYKGGDIHNAIVKSGDTELSQNVTNRSSEFYFVHKHVLPVNAAGQGGQSVTTSSVISSPPGNSTRIEFLFLKGSCIGTPITHEFAGTETVADIKTFIRNKPECDVPQDSSKINLVWVDRLQPLKNDTQSISTLGKNAQITVNFKNIPAPSGGGGRKSHRRNSKKNKRTRRKSLKKQHRRK